MEERDRLKKRGLEDNYLDEVLAQPLLDGIGDQHVDPSDVLVSRLSKKRLLSVRDLKNYSPG